MTKILKIIALVLLSVFPITALIENVESDLLREDKKD